MTSACFSVKKLLRPRPRTVSNRPAGVWGGGTRGWILWAGGDRFFGLTGDPLECPLRNGCDLSWGKISRCYEMFFRRSDQEALGCGSLDPPERRTRPGNSTSRTEMELSRAPVRSSEQPYGIPFGGLVSKGVLGWLKQKTPTWVHQSGAFLRVPNEFWPVFFAATAISQTAKSGIWAFESASFQGMRLTNQVHRTCSPGNDQTGQGSIWIYSQINTAI